MLAEMEEAGPHLKTAVGHVGSDHDGQALLKRVKEIYPDLHPEISPIGPVIGSHIGPGTAGMGWYPLTPDLEKLVNY